jgi:hypothetical protein
VKSTRRGKKPQQQVVVPDDDDEEDFVVRRRDLETGRVEFLSRETFADRLRAEHSPELELLGLLPKKPLKRTGNRLSADQAGTLPVENMDLLLLLPAPPSSTTAATHTSKKKLTPRLLALFLSSYIALNNMMLLPTRDDAIRRQAHERCRSMQIVVSL